VTVDPMNPWARRTCANLCVGRKCSSYTVRCYSSLAAGSYYQFVAKILILSNRICILDKNYPAAWLIETIPFGTTFSDGDLMSSKGGKLAADRNCQGNADG